MDRNNDQIALSEVFKESVLPPSKRATVRCDARRRISSDGELSQWRRLRGSDSSSISAAGFHSKKRPVRHWPWLLRSM